MAWQDVLAGIGGALQGAGAGLNQVQDQRQRDLQRQLQERQLQQQQEEQKRRAVREAYESMVGGFKTDLTTAKPMIEAGFAFEKGEDGSLIKPMSMAERRAEIESKVQEQRLIDQESQMIARDQITNDPSGFMQRPWSERNVLNYAAGGKLETQSPEEARDNSIQLAVAQARAQAQIMAASIPRQTDPRVFQLNQQKFMASQRAAAARLARSGLGQYDPPEVLAQKEEEIFQTLMQAAGGAGPNTSAPTGQSLVGPPGSNSKYIRVQ